MDHYDAFARYFDLFSGQATDDLPVYTAFAQRTGGPVLELGCGTGRVMLALARQGLYVVGVDRSAAMLDTARRKLAAAGLLELTRLVQADLQGLDTCAPELGQAGAPGGFRLAICAQNTFAHLPSTAAQVGMLRSVGRRLQPGGLLLLDIFNPDLAAIASSDGRLVWMGSADDPLTGHTLVQTMARDIDAGEQIEHVTTFMDEFDGACLVARSMFHFDLRYVFRFELELLFDQAGFALEALYGSYELEPVSGDSPRLLAVARRP